MPFRYLLLFVCISLIIISCKKESFVSNAPVPFFLKKELWADSVNPMFPKRKLWGDNATIASTMLNVSYGKAAQQNMDVYLPARRNARFTKSIILIHGGAWTIGDKSDYAAHVNYLRLKHPEYAIFNINYRLNSTSGTTFPGQEMDVKAAVEYIYSKRGDYLISNNFILYGGSAGAHLALLYAYKYHHPVQIKAVIDFAGPTDMVDLYNHPGLIPRKNIAAVVGYTPAENPELYKQSSPINFATAANACPTIIFQGGADPIVNPLRQSQALANKLKIAGVPVEYIEYEGKGHGDDWGTSVLTDAFNRIDAFLWLYSR